MYYEETDLSWRAQLLGFHSWLCSSSTIAHHYDQEKSFLCLYYSERNRKLMVLKNYKFITILLMSPALFLTELLQWLNMFMIGKKAVYAKLKAEFWLLKNYKLILAKRKTQAQKRITKDYEILSQRTYRVRILERVSTGADRLGIPLVNFFYQLNYAAIQKVLHIIQE